MQALLKGAPPLMPLLRLTLEVGKSFFSSVSAGLWTRRGKCGIAQIPWKSRSVSLILFCSHLFLPFFPFKCYSLSCMCVNESLVLSNVSHPSFFLVPLLFARPSTALACRRTSFARRLSACGSKGRTRSPSHCSTATATHFSRAKSSPRARPTTSFSPPLCRRSGSTTSPRSLSTG